MHIILTFILADWNLKLLRGISSKLLLDQIRKRIGHLKLGHNHFFEQDKATDLDWINSLQLITLKASVAKAFNIKLKVEPHVLNNNSTRYSAHQGVFHNVIKWIRIWVCSKEGYSAFHVISGSKAHFHIKVAFVEHFALKIYKGLNVAQCISPWISRCDNLWKLVADQNITFTLLIKCFS